MDKRAKERCAGWAVAAHLGRAAGAQPHKWALLTSSHIAADLMKVGAKQDGGRSEADDCRHNSQEGSVCRQECACRHACGSWQRVAEEESDCGQWAECQEAQRLAQALVAEPAGCHTKLLVTSPRKRYFYIEQIERPYIR